MDLGKEQPQMTKPMRGEPGIFPKRLQETRLERPFDVKFASAVLRFCKGDIIDIGAGVGALVHWLRANGKQAIGVDGTVGIERISQGAVKRCDLSKADDCVSYHNFADTGIFIEVGEHIEAKHEQQVIGNVCAMPRKRLIVTWAKPGQRGYGHVNCKKASDVIAIFDKRGWAYNGRQTRLFRGVCPRPWSRRVLIFEREKPND